MKLSDISKELLSEALMQLMEKKPYPEITVTDIAAKAGVSRLTFYRNFESKAQILTWHIERGFREYLASLSTVGQADLDSAIVYVFSFWKNRSKEISLLIRQNITYILQTPFEKCANSLFDRIGVLQNTSETQRWFLIGGMYASMIQWISEGCITSPETITKELLQMFSSDFLGVK